MTNGSRLTPPGSLRQKTATVAENFDKRGPAELKIVSSSMSLEQWLTFARSFSSLVRDA